MTRLIRVLVVWFYVLVFGFVSVAISKTLDTYFRYDCDTVGVRWGWDVVGIHGFYGVIGVQYGVQFQWSLCLVIYKRHG